MLRVACQRLTSARSVYPSIAVPKRSLSLASFRFPWLSKSPSDVATTSESIPASVKPWHGSDTLALGTPSSYPDVPDIASLDFPITKHERYCPDISALFETWDYDVELHALAGRVRFPADKLEVLRQALIHPSFLLVLQQERDDMGMTQEEMADGGGGVSLEEDQHYGALSSYGMAAARLFVVEYIHKHFPNLPAEGINELTKHLLQEERLSFIVKHMGILDLIQRSTQVTLVDTDHAALVPAFYSVVGALLTAEGMDAAQSFVHDYVIAQMQEENLADTIRFEHPKIMLRHLLREQHKPAPVARLLNEAGHNTPMSVYHVAVYCGNTVIGKGFGRTLQSGEEEACRDALREFFLTEVHPPPQQPPQPLQPELQHLQCTSGT